MTIPGDETPDSEVLYRQWRALRERLEEAVDPASGLPAPLAAYVVEWAGAIRLAEVRALRDEYGIESDPSAEELWPLLEVEDE